MRGLANLIPALQRSVHRQAALFHTNVRFQELSRIRFCDAADLLGRADRDHLAAAVAAFWAQVDDLVGHLDDIQVVLDDQHAVAGIHQALQHLDQLVHIGGV